MHLLMAMTLHNFRAVSVNLSNASFSGTFILCIMCNGRKFLCCLELMIIIDCLVNHLTILESDSHT